MKLRNRHEAMLFVEENAKIVEQVVTNPYSYVRIQCSVGNQIMEAGGFSKCRPGDTYDPDRGYAIAKGRAIAAIAKKLYETPATMHSAIVLDDIRLSDSVSK
jgi:hypothetical protein